MDSEWTLMLQNHQKITIPAMNLTTVSCNKSDTHGKVMFKLISQCPGEDWNYAILDVSYLRYNQWNVTGTFYFGAKSVFERDQ